MGRLQRRGFEVECWDFTPWVNPEFWNQYKVLQIENSAVRTLSCAREFQAALAVTHSAAAIDMLSTWSGNDIVDQIRLNARPVFGLTMVVDELNQIALALHPQSVLSKLKQALKCGDLCRIGEAVRRRFHGNHNRLSLFVRPMADLRVCAGELSHHTEEEYLEKAETLWAHSWDYDVFLKHRGAGQNMDDFVVFIDSDQVSHSDYVHHDVKPYATASFYYPAMNTFFERLEDELGLPVVVAAHPRGRLVEYEKNYPRQQVVQGKTAELVRDAALVVSQSSTGDSFAVLWGKPMLVVTTDELERSDWFPYMEATCRVLKTRRLNADRLPRRVDWWALANRPRERYAYYRQQLIKRDGTPERNSWELVADWLKQKEVKC